jgi:hypothetical protein
MFLLGFAVLFHVSHPYSKTDLTFDSNISIFVFRDKYPALHILFNSLNATFSLLMRFFTSSSAPPSLLTKPPKYWNFSVSSIILAFTSSFVFILLISGYRYSLFYTENAAQKLSSCRQILSIFTLIIL